MIVKEVLASVAAAALFGAIASTVALAAPPQIRTVAQPVMRNPGAPPRPQNPNPVPGQGGTPHHEQYTAVEFTVWTGDDDLRTGSVAVVDVTVGNETIECLLHFIDEDGWGNNSKHHGHQCVFKTPKNWGELRSASMVLRIKYEDSHDALLQAIDNWNVNRVVVTAIDTADKLYPCLLDVRGAPQLIRFSAANRSFDLTETENHC
jgi:hypothetical protein